jgi:peptidoglycan hydrolase-like protein with peptidoglycan-binding domain
MLFGVILLLNMIKQITKKKYLTNLIFTFIFSATLTGLTSAQSFTVADVSCPSYNFTRSLQQGDRGPDVKLIQKILNLDNRTPVAVSGIGSKGNETELYGVATREAVKRFQALFIELIGVADGKVNGRTITVLNSVCKGPYFTGGSGGIYDINAPATTNSKDSVNPSITISAPSNVYTGESYRAWIYASEAISAPNLSSFIISEGAALSDLRKENPSTYKLLITPSKTATHTVSIQLEAESVMDVSGNKNIYSSNEVKTLITPAPVGPDITRPSVDLVNTINLSVGENPTKSISVTAAFSEPMSSSKILTASNFITTGPITVSNVKRVDERLYTLTVTTTATDKAVSTIRLIADVVEDANGNKNNASNELLLVINKQEKQALDPINPDPYNGGSGSGSGLSELLQLLGPLVSQGLASLLGNLGGLGGVVSPVDPVSSGLDYGGITGATGKCACSSRSRGSYYNQSTYFLTSTGPNPTGGYLSPTIPLIGCSIGKYTPFVRVCGQREVCVGGGFGKCKWTCIGPNLDSNGSPMVGIVTKGSLGAGSACGR